MHPSDPYCECQWCPIAHKCEELSLTRDELKACIDGLLWKISELEYEGGPSLVHEKELIEKLRRILNAY